MTSSVILTDDEKIQEPKIHYANISFLSRQNVSVSLDSYWPKSFLQFQIQNILEVWLWPNAHDLPECCSSQCQCLGDSPENQIIVSQWAFLTHLSISFCDTSVSIQYEIGDDMLHVHSVVFAWHKHIIIFQFSHNFQPSDRTLSATGSRPWSSASFMIGKYLHKHLKFKRFEFRIILHMVPFFQNLIRFWNIISLPAWETKD